MLAEHGAASAGELAEHLGSSRVTARRYLEHLAETGEVERVTRLGGRGVPRLSTDRAPSAHPCTVTA